MSDKLRWPFGVPAPKGVTPRFVNTLMSRPGPVIEVGARVIHICPHGRRKYRWNGEEDEATRVVLVKMAMEESGLKSGHAFPCTCCDNLCMTRNETPGRCPQCQRS